MNSVYHRGAAGSTHVNPRALTAIVLAAAAPAGGPGDRGASRGTHPLAAAGSLAGRRPGAPSMAEGPPVGRRRPGLGRTSMPGNQQVTGRSFLGSGAPKVERAWWPWRAIAQRRCDLGIRGAARASQHYPRPQEQSLRRATAPACQEPPLPGAQVQRRSRPLEWSLVHHGSRRSQRCRCRDSAGAGVTAWSGRRFTASHTPPPPVLPGAADRQQGDAPKSAV
jgi:hypothetical protein